MVVAILVAPANAIVSGWLTGHTRPTLILLGCVAKP